MFKALCSVVLEGTYSNLYLKNHLKEVPEKDQALERFKTMIIVNISIDSLQIERKLNQKLMFYWS